MTAVDFIEGGVGINYQLSSMGPFYTTVTHQLVNDVTFSSVRLEFYENNFVFVYRGGQLLVKILFAGPHEAETFIDLISSFRAAAAG